MSPAFDHPGLHPSRHAGKVALVTGGVSGIGHATADRLNREGARVFISGSRTETLIEAAKALDVEWIVSDAADFDAIECMINAVDRRAGRLDVLFANAGDGEFSSLEQITERQFDQSMCVSLKGIPFTVQLASRLMGPGGAVVLNGSLTSAKDPLEFSIPAATRAAIRAFARSWTVDLRARGIRVNVVASGPWVTDAYATKHGMSVDDIRAYAGQLAATTPLRRIGTVEEIASVVSFLASNEASFVAGIELFIDGGYAQV